MNSEATQEGSRRGAEVPPNPAREYRDGEYSWPSYLGFAFLTYNSVLAVYRSINDPWMVAFVVGSYVDLMSLFYFLRVFERTLESSPRRRWLKVVVWTLVTTLTLMFSYKVVAIMPLAVKVIASAMASTTSVYVRQNSNSEATQGSQRGGPDEYFWLLYLGFACVTYNSTLAAYRFINDPWMVAFVVASYIDLMSLFYFLRVFEGTPEHYSPPRKWLKVVAWTVATILTLMFGYKVAAILPLGVKVIVWAMASTTTVCERESENSLP